MRDVIFANQHFYHIYNRGVDKRDIFMDEADCWRFVKSLCLFNDSTREAEGSIAREECDLLASSEPFVRIHAFCLMPNHFHLLVEQVIDGGISMFMHRLCGGFTKYFNKRYERVGALFSGTFKGKQVDDDHYLQHLTRYIHLNPINLLGIPVGDNPINRLQDYRWSSYADYFGRKSYPFVETSFILNFFRDRNEFVEFTKSWKQSVNDQIGHLYFDE